MSVKFLKVMFFYGAAVLSSAQLVALEPLPVPGGLSPGDEYRIVFVTSTTTTAESTDIGTYNTFVDDLGDLTFGDLAEGDWTMIGSTSTVDARDNTGTNPDVAVGVPIYNMNGDLIANHNADLWDGTLINPIRYNELGIARSTTVFTGTQANGLKESSRYLGGSEERPPKTTIGDPTRTNGGWIKVFNRDSGSSLPVYALSPTLTVAEIPEPSTYALLGGCLLAVVVVRRRKCVRVAVRVKK